jgi:hypothetical protein
MVMEPSRVNFMALMRRCEMMVLKLCLRRGFRARIFDYLNESNLFRIAQGKYLRHVCLSLRQH